MADDFIVDLKGYILREHRSPRDAWCDPDDVQAAIDEIERLRDALHEWDALIRHQYSGSQEAMSDMTYAAQRTAHLLHGKEPWPEPRRACSGEDR
jgi:hypothetical protein